MLQIACVGETLEQRKADNTMQVVTEQLEAIRQGCDNKWDNIVIAYEPVWAIGTGVVASPQQAQQVHAAIRKWLSSVASSTVANTTRIIYGGSVKANNCKDIIVNADVDGFLVGGAALIANEFASIIASPVEASKL